jgi:hypothetical protein
MHLVRHRIDSDPVTEPDLGRINLDNIKIFRPRRARQTQRPRIGAFAALRVLGKMTVSWTCTTSPVARSKTT